MGDCCCKKGDYTATSTEDDDFQHVDGGQTLSVTDRYLRAEFMAMARDHHGVLSSQQFVNLLMCLGYGGDGQAGTLLKSVNKDENNVITLDEYYDALKNNPEVMERTSMLRKLFGRFDDNKDGKARRGQIEEGFRAMGIEVDKEMEQEIAKMDENNDGNILYQDFVHTQLKKRGFIPS